MKGRIAKRSHILPLAGWLVVVVALAAGAPLRGQAAPQTTVERAAYQQLTDAYAALRANALDTAVIHFVAALALTPNRMDVRKELAYTYFHVGRNDLARRQFEIVVARDTLDGMAAMELAYLDYESPDPTTLARAHALFGHLRTSRDSSIRARATEAFGNVDGALAVRIQALQADLQREPTNGLMLEDLATAAQERNDIPLATETYQKLAQFYGEPVRMKFARFLISVGKRADAQSLLEALLHADDPFLAEEAHELLAVPPGAPLAP